MRTKVLTIHPKGMRSRNLAAMLRAAADTYQNNNGYDQTEVHITSEGLVVTIDQWISK